MLIVRHDAKKAIYRAARAHEQEVDGRRQQPCRARNRASRERCLRH
jgi:hypothetical protein